MSPRTLSSLISDLHSLPPPSPSPPITYQTILFYAIGISLMSDSLEVMLLSILTPLLHCLYPTSSIPLLIMPVTFAGQFIGATILSPFADHIGRRPLFLTTCTLLPLFGILSSLLPLPLLLPLRFLVGIALGAFHIPFDLYVELLPPTKRGKVMLQTNYFWTAGGMLSLLFAAVTIGSHSVHAWRVYLFLCALPSALALVLMYVNVPESPEWLVSVGREEEALGVVRFLYKASGHELPDEVTLESEKGAINAAESSSGESLESMSRDPRTPFRRFGKQMASLFQGQKWKLTVPLLTVWFCFGFGYYGLVFLSTRIFSKGGDASDCAAGETPLTFDYADIVVSSLSEVFAVWVTAKYINRTGRRTSQMYLYFGAGVALMAMCLVANVDITMTLFFSIIARVAIMGASCVTWLYTPEVYDVGVRATAHSVCFAVARIGAMCCPFVVEGGLDLRVVGGVMAMVDIVAAFVLYWMPESHKGEEEEESGRSGMARVRSESESESESGEIELQLSALRSPSFDEVSL